MQGRPQCIKPMISETPANIHIPNLRELYMKAHARDPSTFTIKQYGGRQNCELVPKIPTPW